MNKILKLNLDGKTIRKFSIAPKTAFNIFTNIDEMLSDNSIHYLGRYHEMRQDKRIIEITYQFITKDYMKDNNNGTIKGFGHTV